MRLRGAPAGPAFLTVPITASATRIVARLAALSSIDSRARFYPWSRGECGGFRATPASARAGSRQTFAFFGQAVGFRQLGTRLSPWLGRLVPQAAAANAATTGSVTSSARAT